GLNDQFSIVKSNVLMMDPLPVISKVFLYAMQQQRQISNNDVLGSTSMINAANTNSSSSPFSCTYCGGLGNKICTHCGFTNYIVDECYRKHEYPSGHKYHK
ncbi:hypothetical protein glysoja_015965, partial [Glycine soja]